jgi:hypothetical protein
MPDDGKAISIRKLKHKITMQRGTAMSNFAFSGFAGLALVLLGADTISAQNIVAIAVPAKAGPVEGTNENSDAFIWRLLTTFAAPASPSRSKPVVFETWASDADTFNPNPRWPDPDAPQRFEASVRDVVKRLPAALSEPLSAALQHARQIDVTCDTPGNPLVGGFLTDGTPKPCIAEQTKRNRPHFDYIVNNKLNTAAGLKEAYAKSFKVDMPRESIAVKGDWIPTQTLLRWIPQIGTLANIQNLYFTATVDAVEYALVALHISSRQNPNWVWGTIEHQLNPGRCDSIGCFDSFGAETSAVLPNRLAANTQYGACPKTQQLKALMQSANLATVWENYCLKSTQVDYTAPDGTPYVLGNSVIEGIVGNGTVAISSCMGCHVYASFGPDGQTAANVAAMLPFNPAGNPIQSVLAGSLQYHFMWGVIKAR